MRLIVTGKPETIHERLTRMGFHCELIEDIPPSPSLSDETACVWLYAGSAIPALHSRDLLIFADTPVPSQLPENAITLVWQDSPFVSQFGFQLAVGGLVEMISRAEDILDALAPVSKGWLHAGGHDAPQFLSQLSQEVGYGLMGLASLINTLPLATFQPIWLGQQQLQETVTKLATNYLQNSLNENHQPFHARASIFDFLPAHLDEGNSPARRLAQLIVWLGEKRLT